MRFYQLLNTKSVLVAGLFFFLLGLPGICLAADSGHGWSPGFWIDDAGKHPYDPIGDGPAPPDCSPETPIPGDMNCDCEVNGGDIEGFRYALIGDYASYYDRYPYCDITRADMNGDGETNGFDIEPFVDALIR